MNKLASFSAILYHQKTIAHISGLFAILTAIMRRRNEQFSQKRCPAQESNIITNILRDHY
jgi:hypothetical protein